MAKPSFTFMTSLCGSVPSLASALCLLTLVGCGVQEATPRPAARSEASGTAATTAAKTNDEADGTPTGETVLRRDLLAKKDHLERLDDELERRDLLKASLLNQLTETERARALIVIVTPEAIPTEDMASKAEIEAATARAAADKKKAEIATQQMTSLSVIVSAHQARVKAVDEEIKKISAEIETVEQDIVNLTAELNKLKTSARDTI